MSMNRRALFGATVAVAALAAPAVTVAQPAADDAELDRLFAALDAAGEVSDRAGVAWNEAIERYEALIGEPPEVLRKVMRDYAAGLAMSGPGKFHDDLGSARERLAMNAKNYTEHGVNKLSVERCQEVVAALEEREALKEQAFVQDGVADAERAGEEAGNVEDEIHAEIHHYRPRTLAGLKRKAEFISDRIASDGALNAWQAAWARTMVEDVMALAAT